MRAAELKQGDQIEYGGMILTVESIFSSYVMTEVNFKTNNPAIPYWTKDGLCQVNKIKTNAK